MQKAQKCLILKISLEELIFIEKKTWKPASEGHNQGLKIKAASSHFDQ